MEENQVNDDIAIDDNGISAYAYEDYYLQQIIQQNNEVIGLQQQLVNISSVVVFIVAVIFIYCFFSDIFKL